VIQFTTKVRIHDKLMRVMMRVPTIVPVVWMKEGASLVKLTEAEIMLLENRNGKKERKEAEEARKREETRKRGRSVDVALVAFGATLGVVGSSLLG